MCHLSQGAELGLTWRALSSSLSTSQEYPLSSLRCGESHPCFLCSIDCWLLPKSRTCLIPSQRPGPDPAWLPEGGCDVGGLAWFLRGCWRGRGQGRARAMQQMCVLWTQRSFHQRVGKTHTQEEGQVLHARGHTRRQSSSQSGRRLSSRGEVRWGEVR